MDTDSARVCAAGFLQRATRLPMFRVTGFIFLITVRLVSAAEAQDTVPKPPAHVQLPQVPIAGQAQPSPNRLEVFSIGRSMGVMVDGRPVELEDGAGALERKVRSLAEARGCRPNEMIVVVHGDKNTKVESVLALVESAQKSGVTSFRLTAMAEALYSADSTVRGGRLMGEFTVRSAPVEPSDGLPVLDALPPIRVRLRASQDGRLVAIAFGNRQIPADLRHLSQRLRELVGDDPIPDLWRNLQVEIDSDGTLRYENVMEAVSVVFGYLDEDARFYRLAGVVTLMIGQSHPWELGLNPAGPGGLGEPGQPAEAHKLTAPLMERQQSEQSPLERTDGMKTRAEGSRDTASGDRMTDNPERSQPPEDALPQPASEPNAHQVLLQLRETGETTVAGTVVPPDENGKLDARRLLAVLSREKDGLVRQGKSPAEATIIIRADVRARTGSIQQIIKICQSVGFEKFALQATRPNQTEGPRIGTKEADP